MQKAYTAIQYSLLQFIIHIYTSLIQKICTLHITVHTSHQLLANMRTLKGPKYFCPTTGSVLLFPGFPLVTHFRTILSSTDRPVLPCLQSFPPQHQKVHVLLPGSNWKRLSHLQSSALFLHLHVCFNGTTAPSCSPILIKMQRKGRLLARLEEMSYRLVAFCVTRRDAAHRLAKLLSSLTHRGLT